MGSPTPWPGWHRAGNGGAQPPACADPLERGKPQCVSACAPGAAGERSRRAGTCSASARTCFPSRSPGAACSGCLPGARARLLVRPTGRRSRMHLSAFCERAIKPSVTLAGWELTPASGSARAVSICYSPAAGMQETCLHSAPRGLILLRRNPERGR